jgi:hypothetical protein
MLSLAVFFAIPLAVAFAIGVATARWAFRRGPAPAPKSEDPRLP